MDNRLILLETLKGLSAGISQQEQHFHLDNLINPIILNPDRNVDPVGMNVAQPENPQLTLSQFASHKFLNAIAKSIEKLMTDHHFPLPENWTYSQLARDIIGEPAGDLVHLGDVLRDLTVYGFSSNYFHQVLNILHAVTDTGSAAIGF